MLKRKSSQPSLTRLIRKLQTSGQKIPNTANRFMPILRSQALPLTSDGTRQRIQTRTISSLSAGFRNQATKDLNRILKKSTELPLRMPIPSRRSEAVLPSSSKTKSRSVRLKCSLKCTDFPPTAELISRLLLQSPIPFFSALCLPIWVRDLCLRSADILFTESKEQSWQKFLFRAASARHSSDCLSALCLVTKSFSIPFIMQLDCRVSRFRSWIR